MTVFESSNDTNSFISVHRLKFSVLFKTKFSYFSCNRCNVFSLHFLCRFPFKNPVFERASVAHDPGERKTDTGDIAATRCVKQRRRDEQQMRQTESERQWQQQQRHQHHHLQLWWTVLVAMIVRTACPLSGGGHSAAAGNMLSPQWPVV